MLTFIVFLLPFFKVYLQHHVLTFYQATFYTAHNHCFLKEEHDVKPAKSGCVPSETELATPYQWDVGLGLLLSASRDSQ